MDLLDYIFIAFAIHGISGIAYSYATSLNKTLSKRWNYRILEREGKFAVQDRYSNKYWAFWELKWNDVSPASFRYETQEDAEKSIQRNVNYYKEKLGFDNNYKVL